MIKYLKQERSILKVPVFAVSHITINFWRFMFPEKRIICLIRVTKSNQLVAIRQKIGSLVEMITLLPLPPMPFWICDLNI